MARLVPSYYKSFACSAGECHHNCCIGWEIDIDKCTLDYYKTVSGRFGLRLKSCIEEKDGSCYFKLDKDKRCPFLNGDNLCDIIINLGEDRISDICTEHPRFINFYDTYEEKGLGICCEEAAKLVLTSKEKMELVLDDEEDKFIPTEDEKKFLDYRQKIFDLLQDRKNDIETRVKNLLEMTETEFPKKTYKEWKDIFLGLENMEHLWLNELNSLDEDIYDFSLSAEWETHFEQLLVYLIYRHLADCFYFEDYSMKIAFAVLGYKIIRRLFLVKSAKKGEEDISDLLEIARLYSAEIEYSEENTETILKILEDAQKLKK